ncbi:phage tail protein [Marinobacter sp.]|uniref:phage tail protein n=1 Tax=Marinobacter sp. TaxID=50741 RepID=UPI003A8DAF2A
MDIANHLSHAASLATHSGERVRATVTAAKAGKAAATDLLAAATRGDLIASTEALRRGIGAAAGVDLSLLPAEHAAKIGRGLRVLSTAEATVSRGIEAARSAGLLGEAAVTVIGPALTDFSGTLASAKQVAMAMPAAARSAMRGDFATVTDGITGKPTTAPVVNSLAAPMMPVAPAASSSRSHLLVLTTESTGEKFFFGLSTAAYDSLRRTTNFNVAAQERLQRQEALQAVNKGGETISISGAIYTKTDAGARQLDTLRRIGALQSPLQLTTGYGDALGRWYLVQIEEEQGSITTDGAPLKQQFTLEFKRYGDDYANR